LEEDERIEEKYPFQAQDIKYDLCEGDYFLEEYTSKIAETISPVQNT